MKIIVTGASGFIGNALIERLKREDHEVIGFIHRNEPRNIIKNVEYKKCDITDKKSLKKAFEKCDCVFHCAAYVKDYGPKEIFFKVNYEETKNLVELSEKYKVKKFIFLSHIPYEKITASNYYIKTKTIAENYLHHQYKENGFPVVVIRPGNVYGPGATTWVLRPLRSIKKGRITLIEHGSGIFLHTYIDNLLDALIAAATKPDIIGKSIDITDGDHSITWGRYLNDLASMIDKGPIKKNLSKPTALFIAKIMMFLHKVMGIDPWVTPQAVETFTNKRKISIKQAKELLDYSPQTPYQEGMKEVNHWIKEQNINDC